MTAAFLVLAAIPAWAEDYPEVPSQVAYNPGYLNVWGEVPGSVLPAGDADPGCNEINAVCRRICADLPPGEHHAAISEVGITPLGYSRGVGDPEVYQNRVERVCRRVKNWGVQTRKTFAFRVEYKRPARVSQFGDIESSWVQISKPLKIGDVSASLREISASTAVDKGGSAQVSAFSDLPKGARLVGTRYQVSAPGSGWIECSASSGDCDNSSARWSNMTPGAGTFSNNTTGVLTGRVIVHFIVAPPDHPVDGKN
jgi:hypothetical protein